MRYSHSPQLSRSSTDTVDHRVRRHGLAPLPALLLLGLPGPLVAQGQHRVPATLPDVDVKTEHWVAPLKDGVAPEDLSHLPLAERIAYDEAHRQRFGPRTAQSAPTVTKPGEGLDPATSRSGVDPQHFHQLDRSSDGTLWAIGGTYKARFGVDGASYVPNFGAGAPRNFPVTFQVQGATLGGEPLPADLSVTPDFVGDTAVYDRGGFEERYDTRIGAVEQLFVFDTLPGSGELVVRLGVASELEGSVQGDGLAWSGALGVVNYSNAVAIDARGRQVAVPTLLEAGVVELRVPAEFVASATLPLTIDPVITTFLPNNSSATDDRVPDIAYDLVHDRYMIIWTRTYSATDLDVWAEMFDPNTSFPIAGSGAYIDFTTDSWSDPKCANNRATGQFLVVASRYGAQYEIWGRTREAESTTQSAQFQVSSGLGNKWLPTVGGDPFSGTPSYYCVAWTREYTAGVDYDIHARLVDPSGTVAGTLISIDNSGSTYDTYPSISRSNAGSIWNVAWERQYNTSDWDIRGAQVNRDGTITTPSFSVDFSPANDLRPDASPPLQFTLTGRPYLITYQRYDGADWDIYASALKGSTRIDFANLSHLWSLGSAEHEGSPSIDTNGKQFALAYHRSYNLSASDFDTYVASVYLAGDQLRVGEQPVNVAFSITFEGYPQICAERSGGAVSDNLGVVWGDYSPEGNIEAAYYYLPAGFGVIGDNYCSANVNSVGSFGFTEASGTSYVSRNELFLHAGQLPLNATLFFITSATQGFVANPSGSAGNLCLGSAIGRYVGPGQIQNTGSSGTASLLLNLTQHPTATGLVSVTAGQTWNFQAWHRDTTAGGGTTSNFTNATSVLFL
jgi:hypothetical protein